jgi:SAM-dependent methyltransferase
LSLEELDRHYRDVDDPVYSEDENISNLSFYYEKLRAVIEKRAVGGRILDIGCSGGYFLDVMNGWDRYGIEISPSYHVAKQKYGEQISCDFLHDGQWEKQSFDVITLLDSFDHMKDPLDVLRICRDILKPGGLIVIKVHDISSLFARISGNRYYALIPPYHLSYFSPRTLRLALEKNGFSFLKNTYIPHILFISTIFHRLSRGNATSLFGKVSSVLHGTTIGNLKIRKNMYDIMTLLATAD